MQIQITSRHNKASATLQNFITDELGKLEKFYDKITSCHVVLDEEHVDKIVEITMNVLNHTVNATAKSDAIGKSIADAIDKVERQLKKLNEKLKVHRGGNSNKEKAAPEAE
ncbi:MAG: ribosome-associated translation inhibitor RaiA [Chitinivibrionales bacterium]|nr:ribosome-associated translation inhibitor RaiA [Chitinivibrionales bacterium]